MSPDLFPEDTLPTPPDDFTIFVKSQSDKWDRESDPIPSHTIHVDDLLGRTFLLPPAENGEQHHAKIISRVKEIEDQDGKQVETIKLLVQLDTKDQVEVLIA